MENVHLSNDLSPTIMVMNALGANFFFLLYSQIGDKGAQCYILMVLIWSHMWK